MADSGGEMQQNATSDRPFRWSPNRVLAAELLAQGDLTDEEVALQVGLKDRTALWRWRQSPDFLARRDAIAARLAGELRAEGLARRENRLAGYNDRYDRLQRTLDARASDPTMAAVPGGDTGVLVREIKFVKVFEVLVRADGDETGPALPTKQYREVEVYTVDTGLLKEMDHLAKQAAEDLGQWVTKGELTGKGGEPLFKSYAGIELEDI